MSIDEMNIKENEKEFNSKILSTDGNDKFEENVNIDIDSSRNNSLTEDKNASNDKNDNIIDYLDSSILDVKVVKSEDLKDNDVFGGEEVKEYEDYFNTLNEVKEKEVVEGTIVGLTDREVLVDIGFKAEGIIDRSEFSELPEVGKKVEVYVITFEDRRGKALRFVP